MIKATEARELTEGYAKNMEQEGINAAHEAIHTIEAVIRNNANEGFNRSEVFVTRLYDSKDSIARQAYLSELRQILFSNGFDVIFNQERKILRIQW